MPDAFGGKTREDPVENNSDLAGVVGENLHRLRTQKNLSLEALSKLAGISRAMLGQIELGKSTPTIRILSRVAAAFGVPLSAFLAEQQHSGTVVLRRQESKVLKSEDGTFASRALFPWHGARNIEFYELSLEPRSLENALPHPAGTTENLVVGNGEVEIGVGEERFVLAACRT